jgi:hypothetical protein
MQKKYIFLLLISAGSSKELLSSVSYGPAATALAGEKQGSVLIYSLMPTEDNPHQLNGLSLVDCRKGAFISDEEIWRKIADQPGDRHNLTLAAHVMAFRYEKGLAPEHDSYKKVREMAPKRTAAFFEQWEKERDALIFPKDPKVEKLLAFKPLGKIKRIPTQLALAREEQIYMEKFS